MKYLEIHFFIHSNKYNHGVNKFTLLQFTPLVNKFTPWCNVAKVELRREQIEAH